ncbi:hypothetical protein AB0N16_02640 [Streptomyces sp. NPDC051105]|uniref:hypothetical protein n=1 Tax=Streptomyces sp. NPDC051105 TaxID=3154843 RepID=UPI00344140C1
MTGTVASTAGSVALSVNESSHGADSTPAIECRDDFPGDRLVGQTSSYLPLRFDCVLDDGSTHPSSPGYSWINTLIAVLALAAVLLLVAKRHLGEPVKPMVTAGADREESDGCS